MLDHPDISVKAWIVVAEDNAPDVLLIREALNLEGLAYRLDAIEDGGEMVEFIEDLQSGNRRVCPDLFVIDLNLPKRSGREILACLRSAEPGARVPCIIMSSSDDPRDRQMAEAAGSYYFRKPSELIAFLQIGPCIRAALQQRTLANTTPSQGDPLPNNALIE